jgi:hypothetical protein
LKLKLIVVHPHSGWFFVSRLSRSTGSSPQTIKSLRADVFLSSALRLVGGPIAALIIIWFMRFDGIVAQAFLISSSVPTAVNTALIAIECKTNPEFASQTVMVSTVISAITLSGVIFLSQILY